MKKPVRRRTEISVETHETKIIRIRRTNLIFCERCQSPTSPLTPEQITTLFQISVADVCRNIETGRFHLTGAARDILLVCGNSINL